MRDQLLSFGQIVLTRLHKIMQSFLFYEDFFPKMEQVLLGPTGLCEQTGGRSAVPNTDIYHKHQMFSRLYFI